MTAARGARLILLVLLAALLAGAAPAAPKRGPAADLAPFFAGREGAFVLLDVRTGRTLRYNPRRCRQRFQPCSTRKIPDGLIGLETGVIPDADTKIKWDGTKYRNEAHNQDHSLRTALAASTNWYFERVLAQVGLERVRRCYREFGYGNRTVGAEYLGDDLQISADEQVDFLLRLYRNQLPLSRRTMDLMRDVMVRERTAKGVLRGKTGTGGHTRDRGPRRPDSEMVATLGWFVGWVEHDGHASIFALNLSGDNNPTGRLAQRVATNILKHRGLL
jgi:beta-lactamase class D